MSPDRKDRAVEEIDCCHCGQESGQEPEVGTTLKFIVAFALKPAVELLCHHVGIVIVVPILAISLGGVSIHSGIEHSGGRPSCPNGCTLAIEWQG